MWYNLKQAQSDSYCNVYQIQEDLKEWNMQLAEKLMEFQGRVLPQEKIIQGNDVKYDAGPQTDWTRELRSKFCELISHNFCLLKDKEGNF